MAGHVSSVRAMEQMEKKITTTVKDATNKHIDPRTGLIQQGPSEMGINGKPELNERHTTPPPSSSSASFSNTQQYTNGTNGTNGSNNINNNNTNSNIVSNSQSNKSQNSSSNTDLINGRLNFSIKNENKNEQRSNGMRESPSKRFNGKTNYSSNGILDSGYGSLDKLKMSESSVSMTTPPATKAGPFYSPKLSQRSVSIKSSNIEYLKRADQTLRNQISFTSEEDEGNDANSGRGSSGFVHLVGKSTSMKDTAYDRSGNNKSVKRK